MCCAGENCVCADQHKPVRNSDAALSLGRRTTEEIIMNIKQNIGNACLTDVNLQEDDLSTLRSMFMHVIL